MSTFPRDFYIPKDASEIARNDALGLVVYAHSRAGKFIALGFAGKRQKPDWHYSFRTEAGMLDYVAKYVVAQEERAGRMVERKAERQSKGRGLEVGDVLRASWGYDQTNIDYYEVTALIGSTMVELREIGAESIETAWAQGKSVPMKGNYIGEPFRRVAKDGAVKVRDWGVWAHKMHGTKTPAGEIYASSHWTAYA